MAACLCFCRRQVCSSKMFADVGVCLWTSRFLSFRRGDRPLRRVQAQELILRLNDSERALLLDELRNFQKAEGVGGGGGPNLEGVQPPSAAQLRAVTTCNAIPFVGFGFLDNFIMIIAGDYIDLTLGTTLGISTLAAAALGNLVSDVAGVGSAWYVENLSAKIGISAPVLTPEQLSMKSTTWFSYLGKAVGVTIGCFLGMSPLLFLHSKDTKDK